MSENTLTNNRMKGIIYIIISAFGFALMSAFVKLSGDLPSFEKTFFRNIVSVVVAAFMVIKNKGSFIGKKENRKILIARSVFGTLGIVLNFYAIGKLVLSDASMLNKLSPFFVVIFSALFLKEKIKPSQMIALIIAFIGALFVIRPKFDLMVIPALAGFFSGMSAAAAYTCVRKLGGREEHYTIVFFFSAFSTIIVTPFMLANFKPMTMYQFGCLLMAGVAASIGQFGITLAYKYAPAKEISIFDYTNIIFAAILSMILFGQMPDMFSFIGYLIIFVASLYNFLKNKKES